MASTRQSRRLSERLASTVGETPSTPAAPSSRRASRSRAKIEPIDNNIVVGGSTKSNSTIPTPTRYMSDDELSTAPTSSAQTPSEMSSKAAGKLPATTTNNMNTYPGFQPASSLLRLEIELPDRTSVEASSAIASDSAKALNKSKYSLAANRKRRRTLGDDDDDDDGSDDFVDVKALQSRVANDAMLAKKLQAEEDMRLPKRATTNSFDSSPSSSSSSPKKLAMREFSPDLEIVSSRPVKKSRSANWPPPAVEVPQSIQDARPARHNKLKGENTGSPLSFDQPIANFADDALDTAAQAPAPRNAGSRRSGRFSRSKDEALGPTSADELWEQMEAARADLSSAIPPSLVLPSNAGASSGQANGGDEDRDGSPGSVQVATDLDDDYESDVSYMSNNELDTLAASAGLGSRRHYRDYKSQKRATNDRDRLEQQHPILTSMWVDLEKMPTLKAGRADQPTTISRNLKPFQLEGLAWMTAMEETKWKGGLLGDEMGLGKTIQAVSLIMSDYPAKRPTLVLVPPVALFQWTSEIASYTDGTLKTLVFHRTNTKIKNLTLKDIKSYDVIMMSYNSLESMYRKQEKGFSRKEGVYKEQSLIHRTHFHRVILDEAHCIKTRSTMTAKACFALKADFRWCLSGTPLQNRIGEFFSLLRFLQFEPFANYICRDCKCSKMEWTVDEENYCSSCKHSGMRHLSVFNQELLNPIQRYGNLGPGREAFRKLRLLTDRIMLRRLKKDHTDAMELPVKRIVVDRQFFSEVETDFANSIMTNSERKFNTYVENGVFLNNYANIFGLIMQMRQVADHPDLILKKNSEGSQNVMICCICDEPAEEAIQSRCRHDFCRECARSYLNATEQPDCPRCHILLAIDLEQPEREQDEVHVKKSSIINRIRMSNWTSSSKIELLVYNLYRLRSEKASHKSIIFSQFTTMLQLIEWRLRRAGITTVMLDGSMSPAQRQASIDYFKNNVDVECFLVSLKAGGVALNLTEASRVFIVDPWWNPAAEWQSADRCHRIGQTRPCVVTRLCIEDSVESRMVLLQEKKTRMINSTINSDDAAMESLTPEDLQFLFRGS
ncbi:DNA repair protein rad16 [Sporothrix curviconia]|uniref:DNA repair protein rad16 n=1 Tax=Sporothrix curviconia TaxID=1260050 RepID=A0ABP0BLQ2_9PEZI